MAYPRGNIVSYFGTTDLDFHMTMDTDFSDSGPHAAPITIAGAPAPSITSSSIIGAGAGLFSGAADQYVKEIAWVRESGAFRQNADALVGATGSHIVRAQKAGSQTTVDIQIKLKFNTAVGSNWAQIIGRGTSGSVNTGYAATVTSSLLSVDKTGLSVLNSTAFSPAANTDYILELIISGNNITANVWDSTHTSVLATTAATDSTYTSGYSKLSVDISANTVQFSPYDASLIYPDLSPALDLEITDSWTMLAWGNLSQIGQSANLILSKTGSNGASGCGFHWYARNASGSYRLCQSIVNAPSYTLARQGTTNLATLGNGFFANTYDGSNTLAGIKLGVNGDEETYETVVNVGGMPTIKNGCSLGVGCKDDAGVDNQTWSGKLDEIAVYKNRILAPADWLAYYNWALTAAPARSGRSQIGGKSEVFV